MTAPSWISTTGSQAADDGAVADDGEVIEGSLRDPELFEVVFRRHAGPINRYVQRRLGADAAEDVVAETFLTAFQQRARYQRDRADARPWLYGIATHLIGRHRRLEVRQYKMLARAVADPVAEPFTDGVDARVSAGSASRRLAAAQRDVLLLIGWEELSYEQAAQALGVPVGTVRSRLSRARGTLRLTLRESQP
jgi:RNA polymerase sigma factor (sigma-70 family)